MSRDHQTKYDLVCNHCGGNRILIDGWLRWDVETQREEISHSFDTFYCEDCDGECKVDRKEVDE